MGVLVNQFTARMQPASYVMNLPFTVGIEIEVNDRNGNSSRDMTTIRRALAHKNLGDWVVKPDYSAGRYGGVAGPEIISPVLHTWEDLRKTSKVITTLKRLGFKTNHRCGLHIHLGCMNLSMPQDSPTTENDRNNFFKLLLRYEEAFFKLADQSRQANHFCSKIPDPMFKEIRRGRGIRAWRGEFNTICNDRYFWVNARSLSRHGTLEFRLMKCELDFNLVKGWACLLLMAACHTMKLKKSVRWGKARAKNDLVLICTLLKQAGCYNREIDRTIRTTAKNWTLSRFRQLQLNT